MKLNRLYLLIPILAIFGACSSTDDLMDRGNYDQVISKAHRKLRGKKHKKDKHVVALEEAFQKATKKDMQRIDELKRRGTAADWEKIMQIAGQIDRRQELVEPYLPLIAKEGYQAKFQFVRVSEILDVAYDNVIIQLYAEGSDLLLHARDGDKIAAREAYESFDRLIDRYEGYRDAHRLREEARDLGINKVRIVQDAKANVWIPDYIQGRILSDFPVSDDFWTRFYFASDSVEADLEARFTLTGVDVGPDALREEQLDRSERVEDGWEYVLDERGNVAKDSLGNDIRETKYTRVRATIMRTHQEKVATVYGQFKVTDLATGRTLQSKPLNGEARFYHRAQWYRGDERALSNSERRYTALQPFPSDDRLVIEAADAIKPLITKELKRRYYAAS